MNTPWPDQLNENQKTLIGELVKGKESAAQLQTLLQKPVESDGSVSAEELAVKILRSFTEALSMLSFSGSNEICQIVAADDAVRACSSGRSSKTSDRNRKRSGVRDRRGCYRRRNASESWIKVSATMQDGYAWRKYGQKEILNSKYPRCYFRCTHKLDQGCKATKQVQRIKQDPLLYQTTYFGHHTCNDDFMAPQIISESDPMDSCLLSFETKIPSKEDSLSIVPPSKEVSREDSQSDVSDSKSLLDSTLWQDLMTFESSGNAKMIPSKTEEAHYEEVVSSFYPCASTTVHGLDYTETFGKLSDLDNDLYFDEREFLQDLH